MKYIQLFLVLSILIFSAGGSVAQTHFSTPPGNPYLPTRYYDIGIPINSNAIVTLLDVKRDFIKDKFIIATPDSADQPYSQLSYNQDVYGVNSFFPASSANINSTAIFRYSKTASLFVSPYQFNPVERTLIHNKKILLRIDYNFKIEGMIRK